VIGDRLLRLPMGRSSCLTRCTLPRTGPVLTRRAFLVPPGVAPSSDCHMAVINSSQSAMLTGPAKTRRAFLMRLKGSAARPLHRPSRPGPPGWLVSSFDWARRVPSAPGPLFSRAW